MGLKIKNWENFQHYKDRKPPWIKLYRDILDDPEWFSLSGKDAKVLVMLWLFASEDKSMQGYLPAINVLSFRLRVSVSEIKNTLSKLKHWVDTEGSDMLASCDQSAIPERERERETEGETEGETEKIPHRIIDHLNKKANKNFRKTDTNITLIRARLKEGYSEDDFISAIDNQVAAWKDDPEMQTYLRPTTLFGKQKFDGYVNNGGARVAKNTNDCDKCGYKLRNECPGGKEGCTSFVSVD